MNLHASTILSHIDEKTKSSHKRTLFPSPNVGAAATPYSRATTEPILTPKINFDKSDLLPAAALGCLRLCPRELLEHRLDHPARHVADVNIAMMTRCEPGRLRNDAGFVEGWMVVVMVGLLPGAFVEGVL